MHEFHPCLVFNLLYCLCMPLYFFSFLYLFLYLSVCYCCVCWVICVIFFCFCHCFGSWLSSFSFNNLLKWSTLSFLRSFSVLQYWSFWLSLCNIRSILVNISLLNTHGLNFSNFHFLSFFIVVCLLCIGLYFTDFLARSDHEEASLPYLSSPLWVRYSLPLHFVFITVCFLHFAASV